MSRVGPTPNFYTRLQRRLHWLVIVLLCAQYTFQTPMRKALAAIEAEKTLGFGQFMVITVHTWGGIGIALIMVWRWQLRQRRVEPNGGHLSQWLRRVVTIHHISLYVVSISMVATGVMHYYIGWQFAESLHRFGKWILMAAVMVHAAGALVHAWQGGTVLQRMMGKNSLR